MSSPLEVVNLTVRYGRATAVDSVSFCIEGGGLHVVVGPNGAGKSSLLRAIYGSVGATGKVLLDGQDLSSMSAMRRLKAGVALVPQGRQLFKRMTVRENFEVMAEVLGAGRVEVDRALDRFPILRARSRQLAGVLSGGEQQMVAVARALMGKPKVLLLDEMATGLAPPIVLSLIATAEALAAEGVAVLLAAPSIGAVRDHIAKGFVMLRGRIVGEETGGVALDDAYQTKMGLIR
jgi:branched-chain amino acid transport system ATP-binding protein